MTSDPNRIAKVVVPLAVAAWLGGIVVSMEGTPAVFEALYLAAFAIAVPLAVFYLIGAGGWSLLARRYRVSVPFDGRWHACATGQMALVGVEHPDFRKMKTRFVGGSLRVATSADALYLGTVLSGLPVLRRFFPALRIPWSDISRAHSFEAPGWFAPPVEPGSLLQAAWDPNYTGKFIEMTVGEPPVFIQLPAGILGAGISRLPAGAWTPR